jgi:hypothetical protein
MKPVRIALLLTALLALGALSLSAQPVISAKSGVIAYVEGKVFLGDQAVEYSVTRFPDMKEGSVVRTEDGRAEILLTPGIALRLGENASLKMISNRLIDTRIELLSGSAVIEADEIAKDNNVTVVSRDASVALSKAGIYRFDSVPGSLKVFKGQAEVSMNGEITPVGSGRMMLLSGAKASVEKFNSEETDSLDNWSHRRGEYLAMANASAAKSIRDSGGYSYGSYGPGLGTGCLNSWAFNQWYGLYTYMPCRGTLYSPYGYRFWSPLTVMNAYYMPPVYRGNPGGYGGGGFAGPGISYPSAAQTSSGYSGVMASAPSYGAGSGGSVGGGAAASSGGGASSAAAASGGGHGGASGGGGHR